MQGFGGKTEEKRDFLEDGMDRRLMLQIMKCTQGVHFWHVCFAVVLICFLLCTTDLELMCMTSLFRLSTVSLSLAHTLQRTRVSVVISVLSTVPSAPADAHQMARWRQVET
jgi:hypothetical protein